MTGDLGLVVEYEKLCFSLPEGFWYEYVGWMEGKSPENSIEKKRDREAIYGAGFLWSVWVARGLEGGGGERG